MPSGDQRHEDRRRHKSGDVPWSVFEPSRIHGLHEENGALLMQNHVSIAWLEGVGGSVVGLRYELSEVRVTLGRGSACQLRLKDPKVSRKHAVICFREGAFEIDDLGSSHGTYINDERISSVKLNDEDTITVGDTALRFHLEQDAVATVMGTEMPETPVVSTTSDLPEPISIQCRQCGKMHVGGEKFCGDCGAQLPQLPESFLVVQGVYSTLRKSFESGLLNAEDYRTELVKLIIEDNAGAYWMLGAASGKWYWYDGTNWVEHSPPLVIPGEAPPPVVSPPPPPSSVIQDAGRTNWGRWLVGVLGLIGVLCVLVFGAYTMTELLSTGDDSTLLDAGIASQARVDEGLGTKSSPEVFEEVSPTPELTPTIIQTEAPVITDEQSASYIIRPYDPVQDVSLMSLTLDSEYLEEASSEDISVFQNAFHYGSSGVLNMGWCALDEVTLNENMAIIQLASEFDGVEISPEYTVEEDVVSTEMVCRYYRTVVEDLEPGTYSYVWSTSYDEPIFDGWDTYDPEVYIREYTIEIEDRYVFVDDFESNSGLWGETEQDNFSIWIEAGELNLQVHKEYFNSWSRFLDREFDDFYLVAHARNVSGSPGSYGVVFRQQDVNNFYYFEINDEGSYRLRKRAGDYIDLIPWTASDAIVRDGGMNSLGVSMDGDEIYIFVNGQPVANLKDSSFQEGSLGLLAGTDLGEHEFHAAFDTVSIDAPP
jgi:pSer/pThr/pTyr-binding forkhead associated (FHA) protein